MIDIFAILYPAFLAGVILAGIHAYLGVRVVERGVIFAGLALAQLAALGTAIAVLQGFDPHAAASYAWSFGFTIIGAAIFARTRSQQAIIAMVYAVSGAATIMAMSLTTGGIEHLKGMFAGNILSVLPQSLIKMALLYAGVALFHFIFRNQLGDFLFYASLGLVVTSSVAIAGVLPVFSYLIAPSVAAMLFASTTGKRLAIGWTMGALVNALGVLLSVKLDLPTGATIVCTFALTLAVMAGVRSVFARKKIRQ